MNLLPYEAYTLETPQSPAAVALCLLAQLRPRSWTHRWRAGAPYEGTVDSTHFQINRVVGWYTKARPAVIIGVVQPVGSGSRIAVTLRPDGVQLLSLALVFTLWPVLVIGRFSALTAYLPMFLLLAYLSVFLSFRWEARQAKRFLRAALAAPPPTYTPLSPYSAFAAPAPTERLPQPLVGGTPASQRYGWEAAPPPWPPAAASTEHETQRLPARGARGD